MNRPNRIMAALQRAEQTWAFWWVFSFWCLVTLFAAVQAYQWSRAGGIPNVLAACLLLLAWVPFAWTGWLRHTGPRLRYSTNFWMIVLSAVLLGLQIRGTLAWYEPWDVGLATLIWGRAQFRWFFYPEPASSDQSTVAASPSAAAPATPSDLPWLQPEHGLEGMAGMADFKAQLLPALAGFRGYRRAGPLSPRNGILLFGPPGTGKTFAAHAIAGELGLPLLKVGVQDLTSRWINESPSLIRGVFRQAASRPCVLFLDELDAVGGKRNSGAGHQEDQKVVNALLTEIDSARSAHHIVLIAATNWMDQLDPALIRDGRFDFRFELPYPDLAARTEVLRAMLSTHGLRAGPLTVSQVAVLWERRSVAFIQAVVLWLKDKSQGQPSTGELHTDDFKRAGRAVSRLPSLLPGPGPLLSDMILPDQVRQEVQSILYRLRNWESLAALGAEPPTGILLYGPPGTGKTLLVQAMARELGDWHVLEVQATDVLQNPARFRDAMDRAAQHRPAFVFLDEADELLRDRASSLQAGATNEVLKAMDGTVGRVPEVVLIAATNQPDMIDPAALRGGRFGEKLFLPRLAGHPLVDLIQRQMDRLPISVGGSGLNAQVIADALGEAAPADVVALVRKAVGYTVESGQPRQLGWEDVRRAANVLGLHFQTSMGFCSEPSQPFKESHDDQSKPTDR